MECDRQALGLPGSQVKIEQRGGHPLTHHFLYLDLLERTESTCSSLHVQGPMNAIFLALGFVLAIDDRSELFVRDILKSFRPADIASVSIDEQQGLDF